MSEVIDNKKLQSLNETTVAQPIIEQSDITEEPQNEEHLHMSLLGASASLRDLYLKVSDDAGQFFGKQELENEMIEFTRQAKELTKKGSIEAINLLLPQLIEISKSYNRQINFAENVSNGILVKHQIRLGCIYNYQKRLLKKVSPTKEWIEWFNHNYGASNLRSAQDYMRLAKTPNIIRYAAFGKERLLEILRAIPSFASSDDPIGSFLAKYGFTYNPENENFMEDWRSSIDAAIAMEKIKQVEKNRELELEISFDQVKKLIDNNVPVDSKIINNMVIIREADGNLADYIETVVLGKKSQNIQIERVEKQESVQRISKKLKEIVEFYTKETDAISEINVATIDDLKQSIEALINLLSR